jgi:hypothetical protein
VAELGHIALDVDGGDEGDFQQQYITMSLTDGSL